MKTIKITSLLLLLSVLLSNCKKDGATGPTGAQGPPGPALVGDIQGHISIWDQFGYRLTANQAGDTVSIDGTNTSVLTDSTGLYTFHGLSSGTYSFKVSKSGFGLTRIQNIQFVGNGVLFRDGRMSQPSTSNITALADSGGTYMSNPNITVYGTITTDPHARSFILYIGTDATVSPVPTTYFTYFTKNVNGNATKVSFVIPLSAFTDAGLNPGSAVYFAAFGINSDFANSSTFEDYATGKTVFTGLSSTPALGNMILP